MWRSYPNQLESSARERTSWRRKLNYCRIVIIEGENWLIIRPAKRQRSDFCGSANAEMNGQSISGLWVAPKMFIIILHTEIGKTQDYI